jgi:hypothetical protein
MRENNNQIKNLALYQESTMLKNGTIFGQPQNKIGRNITI